MDESKLSVLCLSESFKNFKRWLWVSFGEFSITFWKREMVAGMSPDVIVYMQNEYIDISVGSEPVEQVSPRN